MMMKSRDVPVQVAHGWGGGFAATPMMMMSAPMMSMMAGPPLGGNFASASFGCAPVADMAAPVSLGRPMAKSLHMSAAPPMMMRRAAVPEKMETQSLGTIFSKPPFILSLSNNSILKGHSDDDDDDMVQTDSICTDSFKDFADMDFVELDAPLAQPARAAAPPPEPTTDDQKLMLLLSIQSFDGAFRLDSALERLLKTTLDDIRQGKIKL